MANNVIPSLSFHHIALRVRDFDRELRFFTEGLGLKPHTAWGGEDRKIMLLEIGDGGMLELFSGGSEESEANNRYIHFAFRVDDVEAAFARAVKAGATVKSAPAVHEIPSFPVKMTLQCAFVYSPGGAEVEFIRCLAAKELC